ncbi:MAG: D-glycero-beta-D-manno-heptose-7-phosphate kinase [Pyrinomonadaceae bacterium]
MKFLDLFTNARVLIVGDVMLDRYWWGDVTRISPEAPVPIVRLRRETLALGGSANVAANVAGLGSKAILVGCVGNDKDAATVADVLSKSDLITAKLIKCNGKTTTVKTRIVAHNQQVTRIDQESIEPLSDAERVELLAYVKTSSSNVDAVVLSDYAKGVLDSRTINSVIAVANEVGIPVIVDPKGQNYLKYKGAMLLTPNRKEAIEACRLNDEYPDVVDKAGGQLLAETGVDAVLITLGEEGMSLFTRSGEKLKLSASSRDVYDVTGAGDTVIATLAVAMASGCDVHTAARVANAAAGIVVQQIGTTPISLEDLRNTNLEF